MIRSRYRRGAALVLCMIFMVVLLAFGAGLAALSGTNVQMAANQRRAARALAGAESGLEVMRYWLGHVMMEATTPPAEYFATIVGQVQGELADASVANVGLASNGTVPAVAINPATEQAFSAQLAMNPDNPSILDVTVTGNWEADIYVESFSEPPNVVTFNSNVVLQGTSILTPDFDVSFTGNYSSIEGVVAAGSLYFSGNASAVLHGSLISYSGDPTVVEGNVSLTFDRAGSVKLPAGFDTKRILTYNPASYTQVY